MLLEGKATYVIGEQRFTVEGPYIARCPQVFRIHSVIPAASRLVLSVFSPPVVSPSGSGAEPAIEEAIGTLVRGRCAAWIYYKAADPPLLSSGVASTAATTVLIRDIRVIRSVCKTPNFPHKRATNFTQYISERLEVAPPPARS